MGRSSAIVSAMVSSLLVGAWVQEVDGREIPPGAGGDRPAARAAQLQSQYAVAPEDFGAVGDGTADDRLKINMAAAYVCRRGWGVLRLERRYAVWDDMRTSDPANNHAYDGQHVILGCGAKMPVTVEMFAGSALLMRGLNGASPATHWQKIYSQRYKANAVWRGSGIFIRGGASNATAPGPVMIRCMGRPGSCLIDGGSGSTTRVYTIPASPDTGDGWDITQKGVQQENDYYHGDLTLDGLEITGFKGELQYQSGHHNGVLTVRNCYLHDGNGDGLNPSDPVSMKVDRVRIARVFQWIEGVAGENSWVRDVTSDDTASGGTLAGGSFGSITVVNGVKFGGNAVPAIRADGGSPWLTLQNLTIRNAKSNAFLVGSYVRGSVKLIDSYLGLSAGTSGAAWSTITNVDLDIAATADHVAHDNVFYINGGPVGPKYVDAIDQVHIVAHAQATASARAANRIWLMPFAWGGGLGQDIVIENSSFESKRYPANTYKTDRMPFLKNNQYIWGGDVSGAYARIGTDTVISPASEVFFLTSALGGPYSVGLTTVGYADGQQVRLIAKGIRSPIILRGAGLAPALNGHQPTRLTEDGQEVEIRFNKGLQLWTELRAPNLSGHAPRFRKAP